MSEPLPLVVVSPEIPRPWCEALDERVEVRPLTDQPHDWDTRVVGILPILTTRVDGALLDRFPRARVVSNMAVGVDNIDLEACRARGVVVGNTPGVLTDATAEVAMMLTLAVARNLAVATLDAREGRWGPWHPTGWIGEGLTGRRFGVIGLGAIGAATAARARAFGCHIDYAGPRPRPAAAELQARHLPLDALLEEADIVSVHCPLTLETRHLVDSVALRRMKPDAILINTARGDVVDQAALLRALDEGWISGAGLDVTSPEPLPPTHPLFAHPRCLIAPHIGSATRQTRRAMAALACQNLLAGVEGAPLPHQV